MQNFMRNLLIKCWQLIYAGPRIHVFVRTLLAPWAASNMASLIYPFTYFFLSLSLRKKKKKGSFSLYDNQQWLWSAKLTLDICLSLTLLRNFPLTVPLLLSDSLLFQPLHIFLVSTTEPYWLISLPELHPLFIHLTPTPDFQDWVPHTPTLHCIHHFQAVDKFNLWSLNDPSSNPNLHFTSFITLWKIDLTSLKLGFLNHNFGNNGIYPEK